MLQGARLSSTVTAVVIDDRVDLGNRRHDMRTDASNDGSRKKHFVFVHVCEILVMESDVQQRQLDRLGEVVGSDVILVALSLVLLVCVLNRRGGGCRWANHCSKCPRAWGGGGLCCVLRVV